MNEFYDMIVIGGGPGGCTAALYGARAGLEVLLIERMGAGGQMNLTGQIDNYPGFPEGVDGFALSTRMLQGAERFGVKTRYEDVRKLDLAGNVKTVQTDGGEYRAKAVVMATGANPRRLGLAEEQEFVGRGVSYCAHCDGVFYQGKTVVVVGGGNSAVAEALHLSRMAGEVILVHRRDSLRATRIDQEALMHTSNIRLLYHSRVTALLGADRLSGVLVQDLETGEEKRLEVQGLFISIGREPATALVKGQLTLTDDGYILAGEDTQTNIPGVYAVGDVRAKALRQIVTAVADGAMAAHMAERWLTERE